MSSIRADFSFFFSGQIDELPTSPPLFSPLPLEVKKVKVAHTQAERRVPELIPVLGSQPAGDVSYEPDGRLLLLSTRHAVMSVSMSVSVSLVDLYSA